KDNKYKLAKVGKYVGSILFATVVTLGLTTQVQEIHADATTKTVSQSASTVSSSTSTSSAATSSSVVNSSSSNNATTAKSISSSDNSTAKTAAVQTKQNTDTKPAAASSDAESVAVTAATQTKQQTNAKAAKTAASVTLSAQSSSTADSATSKAEQSQATSSSAASSSSAATNNDETADTNTDSDNVNYILQGGVTVKGVNKTALNEAMKNAYSKYNQAYNDTSEEDYYDGIDNLITILSKSAVLNRTLGISQGEADAMTAELQQAVNNLHLKKRKLDFSKFDKINSKIDSLYQDGNIVYLYSNSSVEPESAVIKYSDDSFRNLMYVSGNVSNEYEDYNSQSDIDSAVSKLTSAFNSLVPINEPVSMATITNAEKTYNDLLSDKVESELYDAGSILVDKDQTSEADINNYISAEDAYHKVNPGYGHEGESDYEGPVTFSKEKILAAINQVVAATKKLKTPNTTNLQNLFEQVQVIQGTTKTLYEDTYKDFITLEQAAAPAGIFVSDDDMIHVWDFYYFDFNGFDNGSGEIHTLLPYYPAWVTSQSHIDTLTANLQKALTNYQQAVANHNKPANNTANNQTNKNNQPATNNQTNKNNQPATNNQTNKNNQPTTNNQANKNNQPATNNQTNKNGQVKENGHWYLYKNGVKQTGLQAISDQHKTVYYNPDGQMQYGQQKVNGHWYLFDKATGAMKTGLQAIPDQHKTVYYNPDGQMQYGQQKVNGHWYLFDKATGAMKTGLQAIPDQHKTVYYSPNGQMQYGQQKVNGHWYLFDKATGAMKTGLQAIPDQHKTVYYSPNGQMQYGQQKVNGKVYNFDKTTGAMKNATSSSKAKTGQVNENGHWYLYKNGVKQTGLQTIPDQHKTVYYNSNGQMQYGQQKINGHWYLFDKATGAMKTGLQAIPDQHKTVYYSPNGQMQYGQQKINGHWYLFDKATGAMKTGMQTIPEQHKTVYYNGQGQMVYGTQKINGKTYHFNQVTGAEQ
ncbi:MAG: hypothetical protein ABF782_09810, partial [Liquorilactobacillus ghanensis]